VVGDGNWKWRKNNMHGVLSRSLYQNERNALLLYYALAGTINSM
jgi:hypothetical protein